jgi:hypothetical protein
LLLLKSTKPIGGVGCLDGSICCYTDGDSNSITTHGGCCDGFLVASVAAHVAHLGVLLLAALAAVLPMAAAGEV